MKKFVSLNYGNRFYVFTCSSELSLEQVAEALAASGRLIADPIYETCDAKLTKEEVLKLINFIESPPMEKFIEAFKLN